MDDQQTSREFDIIIFGATGYSGQRIIDCAYTVGKQWTQGVKIGICGRSQPKLQRLVQQYNGTVQGFMLADVNDRKSIVHVASQTRCLINCVGPYMKYGQAVTEACLVAKTDYVDLCGETEYIDFMKTNYHKHAKGANVLIVPACGFDSVPADAMFMHMISQLTPNHRKQPVVLTSLMCMGQRKRFWGPFGGMGNGTLQTILRSWHYGNGLGFGEDSSQENSGVGYFSFAKKYSVHSEMFSDAYIVRESQANLPASLKPAQFEYSHAFGFEFGIVAYIVACFLWIGPKLLKYTWLYLFLSRLMSSGGGPSKSARENAKATVYSLLTIGHKSTGVQTRIGSHMTINHDPNDFTAMSILRCSIEIAKNKKHLAKKGGVVTTATAFGDGLLRLVAPFVEIKTT